ncbi:uncharacterized protein LOC128182809 [Crassostrea angulata]|uniref:uncharacterized protein LOC128182809 n=1 Tax=Magallana angulata TaxID=2784310 RepID=UPI0022B20800|nr:uncharacterized protein LOC128182809 [Crassostrea angulata]XP_052707522.1 uncharacterized protein LOC128182809 [Crassostrea angulata]
MMNYSAEDLNEEVAGLLYFNTGLLSFYLFLGLSGNGIVLFIYTHRIKRTEERYFIPVLAIADIFAILSGVVLGIVSNFHRANYVIDTFCKVGYYLTWTTTSVSGIIILLIALNRHLMICRPTGPQLTVARKRRAIVAVIIFSIVSSGPMLYFLGKRQLPFVYKGQHINATLCTLRFSSGFWYKLQMGYFALEIFLAVLNMLLTCGFYIPVGVKIYQRFKSTKNRSKLTDDMQEMSTIQLSEVPSNLFKVQQIDNSYVEDSAISTTMSTIGPSHKGITPGTKKEVKRDERGSSVNRKKRVRRKQVKHNFTTMFATIIGFYILAYLPTLMLMIIPGQNPAEFYFSKSPVAINLLVFLQRAFLLNNICNAFIYTYFDLSFRKEVKKLLCLPCL